MVNIWTELDERHKLKSKKFAIRLGIYLPDVQKPYFFSLKLYANKSEWSELQKKYKLGEVVPEIRVTLDRYVAYARQLCDNIRPFDLVTFRSSFQIYVANGISWDFKPNPVTEAPVMPTAFATSVQTIEQPVPISPYSPGQAALSNLIRHPHSPINFTYFPGRLGT